MENKLIKSTRKPTQKVFANMTLRATALVMQGIYDECQGTPQYGKKGKAHLKRLVQFFDPSISQVYQIDSIGEEEEKIFYAVANFIENLGRFVACSDDSEIYLRKIEKLCEVMADFEKGGKA